MTHGTSVLLRGPSIVGLVGHEKLATLAAQRGEPGSRSRALLPPVAESGELNASDPGAPSLWISVRLSQSLPPLQLRPSWRLETCADRLHERGAVGAARAND